MRVLAVILLLSFVALAHCGGGIYSAKRDLPRLPNTVTALQYPCRFDCKQLVTGSAKTPLFASCSVSSVVAYTGDFFGQNGSGAFNIDFQCFTPNMYQNFYASRGKVANLLSICQDHNHGCRKTGGATYNTAAGAQNNFPGVPALNTLSVVTTPMYYQWFAQYEAITFINNVLHCPASFTPPSGNENAAICSLFHYPELFNGANPLMPSTTSNSFTTTSTVPSPVNPHTSYVQGFLGNFTNINPYPSTSGDSETLLQEIEYAVTAVVLHGCTDPSVNIMGQCNGN